MKEIMRTPMQELIEQLKEQAEFIKDDDCVQDKFYRTGLRNAIKYAESMLEKEKEVMCEFGLYCTSNGSLNEIDYVFNETFKTKRK